jgi:50S ribosomal protein L16 3-hydroxylase
MRRFFGRAPFASPDCAQGLVKLFDWDTLDRVLAHPELDRESKSDVLVVKQGRLLPTRPPRSLAQARLLLAAGSSLVVRHSQQLDPSLGELAARFTREVPGTPQVQLFITPAKQRGFGWHYDAEEVFVVQTVGTKEYFFKENTINPRPAPAPSYDFSGILRERTATLACTLVAGDWLYLPSGWWHAATALEDSLSISVGIFPAE